MISPQELRIDNWVYDRSKTRIVRVWGIDSNHDQITVNYANGSAIYKVDLKDFEPIELTEEWILKFRFWKDENSKTFKIDNCSLQLDNYHEEGFMKILSGDDYGLICYVHQLQNLYFALTGEELTIKEQK